MNVLKEFLDKTGEVGEVESVVQFVILAAGLPGATVGERVVFESGQHGFVTALMDDTIEILVLSHELPRVGMRVARTGEKLKVPTGEGLLGLTVNALGVPVGQKLRSLEGAQMREIEVIPAGIVQRKKISRPLETGTILVDLMIPIGRGQRELIMGDRKTGKTHLALRTVITQAKLGTVCVYAAVGKKQGEIKRVEEYFAKAGITDKLILVVSSSQDGPGEIFLTPYTAMTMAEYFRDEGKDVLVVLDDMSTHAKFYREISLLGRRFPGRDSYPGDVFYTHSRLLERAGNFINGGREAAITCLPIMETAQRDFSGFIQTNMMSMTDGHVFFDSDLYFAGRRPAINIFISVTRVGRQTQTNLRREISQMTLGLLNNYERTQKFMRFGAELSDNSRQIIRSGERLLKFFDQRISITVPVNVQTVLWALLWLGVWENTNMERLVVGYEKDAKLRTTIDNLVSGAGSAQELLTKIREGSEPLLGLLNSKD